jgi:hypothetical protein
VGGGGLRWASAGLGGGGGSPLPLLERRPFTKISAQGSSWRLSLPPPPLPPPPPRPHHPSRCGKLQERMAHIYNGTAPGTARFTPSDIPGRTRKLPSPSPLSLTRRQFSSPRKSAFRTIPAASNVDEQQGYPLYVKPSTYSFLFIDAAILKGKSLSSELPLKIRAAAIKKGVFCSAR